MLIVDITILLVSLFYKGCMGYKTYFLRFNLLSCTACDLCLHMQDPKTSKPTPTPTAMKSAHAENPLPIPTTKAAEPTPEVPTAKTPATPKAKSTAKVNKGRHSKQDEVTCFQFSSYHFFYFSHSCKRFRTVQDSNM